MRGIAGGATARCDGLWHRLHENEGEALAMQLASAEHLRWEVRYALEVFG